MTVPAELEPPAQLPAAPVSVERDLSWTVSRHARRLFSLALVGLGLAVATRRPELVAVAAPALVLLCTGRGPGPGRRGWHSGRARPEFSRVSRSRSR